MRRKNKLSIVALLFFFSTAWAADTQTQPPRENQRRYKMGDIKSQRNDIAWLVRTEQFLTSTLPLVFFFWLPGNRVRTSSEGTSIQFNRAGSSRINSNQK